MTWTLKANIRGPQGHSVASAAIATDDHLRLTLTSGTVLDAGDVRGPQGLPGAATLPTDDAVAAYVSTAGTSATKTALASRFVAAKVFTAGAGDQTAALQSFLTGLFDGDYAIIRGTADITTVTLAKNSVHLRLDRGAVLNKTTAFTDGLVITGTDVTLEGGTIVSPASWDGANVTPTYAVVRATGARHTIRDVTLNNVPKVGIMSRDADGTSTISGCRVTANYPAASWTEVETVNFGIMYDPGVNSSRIKITGNIIKSSVQGVFIGNYGVGSSSGSIVSANDFEGCHNHAIYNAGGSDNMVVSGNTMVDCSRPIAMTGEGHAVTHNTMTTGGTGGNLNAACGIHMRNAIGCTVSFNRMKGDVFPTVPAIDFSPVSGGVVNRDNKIIGNQIEVTGTAVAMGIRIGTSAITAGHNNIVQSNIVRAPGVANQGVIAFFTSGAAVGYGNKCLDNDITVTGAGNGIHLNGQTGAHVRGNTVRFEYDAGATTTLGGVYFDVNSTANRVRDNDIVAPATFGTNVTVRGMWEAAGTTANRIGPNRYSFDLTKLTAGLTHVMQGTSSSVLDEALPGAPTVACGPGSRWQRTDGGASTTQYIKESAANSGVWRAV